MCMFCRSLFVLLYLFFWPLCCLFFFDIRILITPLVSSNSSYPLIYMDICCFLPNTQWSILMFKGTKRHLNIFDSVLGTII